VIGAVTGLIAAVSGLLIALNKAGLLDGDGGNEPKPKTASTVFPERPGIVYFDGSTMYVHTKRPRSPVVALSEQEDPPLDVVMSTRAEWVSGASDYGVSLICRRQSPKNYYLLGMIPSKRGYNIARYRDGRLTSLTGGIKPSPHVDSKINEVTARCLGDRPTILTLAVNGQILGRETDPEGLPAGDVGIRVGSDESRVTVGFEDFKLR
jgi:hypothetical protein